MTAVIEQQIATGRGNDQPAPRSAAARDFDVHELERRFRADPLFSGRVHAAVARLRIELHGRPDAPVSDTELALLVRVASMGVRLSETSAADHHDG